MRKRHALIRTRAAPAPFHTHTCKHYILIKTTRGIRCDTVKLSPHACIWQLTSKIMRWLSGKQSWKHGWPRTGLAWCCASYPKQTRPWQPMMVEERQHSPEQLEASCRIYIILWQLRKYDWTCRMSAQMCTHMVLCLILQRHGQVVSSRYEQSLSILVCNTQRRTWDWELLWSFTVSLRSIHDTNDHEETQNTLYLFLQNPVYSRNSIYISGKTGQFYCLTSLFRQTKPNSRRLSFHESRIVWSTMVCSAKNNKHHLVITANLCIQPNIAYLKKARWRKLLWLLFQTCIGWRSNALLGFWGQQVTQLAFLDSFTLSQQHHLSTSNYGFFSCSS